jgi:hypothetical protein
VTIIGKAIKDVLSKWNPFARVASHDPMLDIPIIQPEWVATPAAPIHQLKRKLSIREPVKQIAIDRQI